jgi:hypothetical protein
LLPLIIAVLHFKNYTREYKVITLHLLIVVVLSGIAVLLWLMKHNNLPLLHLYTIAEFLMVSWFYSIILKDFVPARLILAVCIAFVVFAVLNSIFIQSWFTFNTFPRSVESLWIIGLSLITYYKMLSELKIRKMERSPVFWINTGFFVYFSGALFLFSLSNYILSLNHRLNIYIWTIHAILSILLYLFIFLGLCNYRNK